MLTCEHASAAVPADLARLFVGAEAVLASHRGSDLGALDVARRLARLTDAPLVVGQCTRLVVDLNRSEGHRALFSEFTRPLPHAAREELLVRLHRPHRRAVDTALEAAGLAGGVVVHLGVHSFTPDLPGDRDFELSLLYDPARPGERALYRTVASALRAAVPGLRVRANQPYKGTSDGLTRSLREVHSDARYRGLELELNQGWLARAAREPSARQRLERVLDVLADTLVQRH